MYKNGVWTLVELSEFVQPVKFIWVFRKERNEESYVERYKARLVTKGYNQQYRIYYDEIFSHVARIQSIRVILA